MDRSERSAIARRHLDARVSMQTTAEKLTRPPRGWLKAIREALGMTTAQLARRMNISQPGVVMLEKSEASGTIKLETLHRAAEAMNCKLVYALVPVQPLEAMVRKRARFIATQHLDAVEHTMRLENQGIDNQVTREQQLGALASQIRNRHLWDE